MLSLYAEFIRFRCSDSHATSTTQPDFADFWRIAQRCDPKVKEIIAVREKSDQAHDHGAVLFVQKFGLAKPPQVTLRVGTHEEINR